MNKSSDCFVSVVAPIFNQVQDLLPFLTEAHERLSRHYDYFEIILVDDGSADSTNYDVKAMLKRFSGCRYLRLSRNFGLEIAISAGFDAAIGDVCVVTVPGYDPLEKLTEFVSIVRTTGRVAVGRAAGVKRPLFYSLFRRFFHKVARSVFQIELVEDATHFMAMNRQALNSVTAIKDKFRYVKAFATFSGFPIEFVTYTPLNEQQYVTRTIAGMTGVAIDVITSNSLRPLRFVSALCFLASCGNLAYVAYIFAIALFKDHVAEGWVTLSAQLAATFFVLSLAVMVINEYLGRILVETRDRPFYFVKEESVSQVLLSNQSSLRNVVNEAGQLEVESSSERL